MMTTLLGALCCGLLVFGGALVHSGDYFLGLLTTGAGGGCLGVLFAMAKLSGFTHFVGSRERGITVGEVYQHLLKDASSIEDVQVGLARDLYVQTDGAPVRAAGMYFAKVEGKDTLVVEAIHLGEADL